MKSSAAVALTLALVGCSNPRLTASDAGAPFPSADAGACDPLTPHELPVTLGRILGIGKDSGGTTYLADEVPTSYLDRVFISDGNVLWRKRVKGSGSSGGQSDVDYTFSYEDGSKNLALIVQIRGGTTTAMALGPSDSRAFFNASDPAQVPLAVVDASAIGAMTLRNLPGDVFIEYVADVSNGNVIVVTRPLDDWHETDVRVFYGTSDAMLEQPLISFSRGEDTYITFQVGPAQYLAHFVMSFAPVDAGVTVVDGPGTLETGDSVWTITERQPTPTTLSQFSFTCLGR